MKLTKHRAPEGKPREPLYRLPEIADRLNAGIQTCRNLISNHRIQPAFKHRTGYVYHLSHFKAALEKEKSHG